MNTKTFFAMTLTVASLLPLAAAAQQQLNPITSGDCAGLPCGGNAIFIATRIYRFIDAAITVILAVAVLYLLYAGYKYISSQGSEEASAQAKRQIVYAVIGIVLTLLALSINSIYPIVSGITRGSPEAILNLSNVLNNFIDLALFLVGTAAAIYLLYAGYSYITARGDYELASTAKRQIVYAIIGIVVAAGARIISSAFIVPETGTLVGGRGGGDTLATLISGPINAVLTLVGIAATAYIILAGVMYFSSQGDEQRAEAAKQQLIYGVVGIAIIVLSAAIVNFVILALLAP